MPISDIRDTVKLHNGVEMPWFGLGVFRAEEGGQVEQAIRWALDCGYRSIDTAAIYGNEEGVGKALRGSGVPREEIFVTTKLWNNDQGYESTFKAYDASLERLGLDYVDLYLIHWPVKGRYTDSWHAMEHLYKQGRVRAIGVSNFLVHHLEHLINEGAIVPMVNQVEFHPHLVQPDLLKFCKDNGIVEEAWSPIMRGQCNDISTLIEIGEKHGKTPVQVVLRWDLQHGVITIPKSVHKERIESNADIFDFELSNEEMAAIDALDKDERMGPDPDNFSF
jgi:diketogulonate reductase-like aldo/keto reductase